MGVKQSFLLTCTRRIPDELCTGRIPDELCTGRIPDELCTGRQADLTPSWENEP